ncbi:MAG: ATP-binding protein, partial [Thermoanaerobaculia bacterium]|nr:ATP-binding protein [Thermoanaerobaculia bacterium]
MVRNRCPGAPESAPRCGRNACPGHVGTGAQVSPEYATIITTNLEYEEWHNFLGNKALVDALLSRLRHQCHTVRIDGPTLRDPQ